MSLIGIASLSLAAGAAAASGASQGVSVMRAGSEPAREGSPENFTGKVRVEGRFQREAPARVGGATVTFAPGARTAWHSHPLGQTLIVTAGDGFVQSWGGPIQPIRPGDVVWIPPGVKHWHGAGRGTAMTHIAITEAQDGKSVEWMEQVSADQYPH
jgi:quercetin dioxygenase-like cupin family protein